MPISRAGICNGPAVPTTGTARRRGLASACGVTLLELLIVVFIVSLLTGIVFPALYRADGAQVKSDARRLLSVVRYLNDEAIAAKEPCSLLFDLGHSTITWKAAGRETREALRSLRSVAPQSRGELAAGQVEVVFGPLGIQEQVTVRLKEGSEGMAVLISPFSGRAKVKEMSDEDSD